jgi:hypothetical protein
MKVEEFCTREPSDNQRSTQASRREAARSRTATRIVPVTRLQSNSCWLAPVERVSILLSHTRVKITEKHYAPSVRERQEQAEADVKRTWAHDPVALLETKGTPEVHAKRSALNWKKIKE